LQLKECFQAAGFDDVRTLLSSGNVVFTTRESSWTTLERQAGQAILSSLGYAFPTIVRPTEYLQDLVASDPFAEFTLPPAAKRVVTFLRRAESPGVEPGRPGARPATSRTCAIESPGRAASGRRVVRPLDPGDQLVVYLRQVGELDGVVADLARGRALAGGRPLKALSFSLAQRYSRVTNGDPFLMKGTHARTTEREHACAGRGGFI
jgi:hypothetical protein